MTRHEQAQLFLVLQIAHRALRWDTTQPQTLPTLDAVSDAIRFIEATCRAAGHQLPPQ